MFDYDSVRVSVVSLKKGRLIIAGIEVHGSLFWRRVTVFLLQHVLKGGLIAPA